MIKQLIFIFLIAFLSATTKAQNIGVGADAMYNFQTESFGFGARVNFFPNSSLSIVPQVAYYPGFNKINEYYFGMGLEQKIIRGNTFNFYLLAHGAYNLWANHEESTMDGAQASNWNAEVGAGITTNRCLRPFLEYRYNFKFQETHLRLGLLYIFGCNSSSGNGGKYGGRRKGGTTLCPAYH
ncbi:MAG: hypothetical protein VR77_04855 [Flavobacteriales bacterium BRH_c54]|nr:MAG: hypothetical protein VR77_04855 [Flavobacteriales bacterium BRH_c54]